MSIGYIIASIVRFLLSGIKPFFQKSVNLNTREYRLDIVKTELKRGKSAHR